jgi:hypothetical protein
MDATYKSGPTSLILAAITSVVTAAIFVCVLFCTIAASVVVPK